MLVVEDDPASGAALRTILRRLGMEVTLSTTVFEGLRDLLAVRPDVVLLDLMLPDGDGEQILAYAREHLPGTKVYVLTGSSDLARLDHVLKLKPDCVLSKPVDLGRLLAQLQN